ncbi:formylglycine-generating enzyme family protein [Candidatus Amarolinea aalborgensis]|uniref:formylglycine-generating enzyme family protein n=1 Tax=Candidatus Amarolinea aalborgensis TaxID=2249329 RepID=UPI003BF9C72D
MNLSEWKTEAHANLRRLAGTLRRMAPGTLYGALASASVLPVVIAASQGDFAAVAALGSLVGGVGGNLIANQLQAWKDRSEADLALDLQAHATADPAWRDALDQMLNEFQAPQVLEVALDPTDRSWFADLLRRELAAIGSLVTYQATAQGSDNAIAQGSQAKAASGGGVVADTIHGPVIINPPPPPDPARPDPASLRRAYLNRVLEQAGALSLGGVDPRVASDAKARLNLAAVYTALLTQTQEFEERGARRLETPHEGQRLSAVAQLNRHARLVVLGDPGSGKSTFVNFVALCLAGEALGDSAANLALLRAPLPPEKDETPRLTGRDEKQEEKPQPWQHGALLPVQIVLRDLAAHGLPAAGQPATAEHLWQHIVASLRTASCGEYEPFLRRELREQGGLLLLDGLDEVPEADQRRVQIRQAIEDFAASFPRCRILITSRTYAYQQQDWRLPGFAETVLAPFSAGQIQRFIDRWYAHIGELRGWDAANAQGRAQLLANAVFGSDRLRSLAERPLLLALMASLHAWRGGSLPEKREELYADAVELLLDWWESQRIARDARGQPTNIQPSLVEWLKLDREKVRAVLHTLAYQAHASQPTLLGTADIAEETLVTQLLDASPTDDIKPKRLVEYLSQRAGILLPRGVKVYTFPHRTFQEYLAACYLTDHDYPTTLAVLARQAPERWREVALLAGAKAARGTATAIWLLVDELCYQEPADPGYTTADAWGAQLAGQALVEIANLGQISAARRASVQRVSRGLIHLLQRSELPPVERALAGRTLARLGDPRPEALTAAGMQFCYIPAGPFWMGSQDDPDAEDNEQPQRQVDLAYDYWIGRYPVTNAQFGEFAAAGGYREARYWGEAQAAKYWQKDRGFKGNWDNAWRLGPYDFGEPRNFPNHPVVGVTWYEALAYTRWLGERLAGRIPAGWKVRLPNEPEWEKAARGGVKVPAQALMRAAAAGLVAPVAPMQPNPDARRRYPWGNDPDANRANSEESGIGTTSAVGCFPGGASVYGAEELSGNVWEWTRSLWGSDYQKPRYGYPYVVTDGRENLAAGSSELRVVRGGAYYVNRTHVRCARRRRDYPSHWGNYRGFRVVVSP